ncbi:hypothetical protein [Nocardioides aquiterrae]|uniref:DUF222 domain-containing protein n=1 Tax=Nocardioides aquiterrae TaxID=203799 RepID=A0ABN1UGL1_9ACTN
MTATDPHAPLRQAGFDDAEIQALEHVWRNDAIRRVLDPVAAEVRDWGGTVAAAFDAVQHGLTFGDVINYLAHGFTAHQVHVLLRDPNCQRILTSPAASDDAGFLGRQSIPRQVVVNVLRIAHTPDEAGSFLDQYENALDSGDAGQQAVDELAAAFQTQIALGGVAPEPHCGCRL